MLSKDGKAVFVHDDDFSRLCGVKKRPDELDFSEFPNFLEELSTHFNPEEPYIRNLKKDDKTFSSVEEVFSTLRKETILHIEIKGPNKE